MIVVKHGFTSAFIQQFNKQEVNIEELTLKTQFFQLSVFAPPKKTVSNEAKAELPAEFFRATQTFVLFRF